MSSMRCENKKKSNNKSTWHFRKKYCAKNEIAGVIKPNAPVNRLIRSLRYIMYIAIHILLQVFYYHNEILRILNMCGESILLIYILF